MASAEDVADLVRDRDRNRRARVMHDEIGVLRIRRNARRQAATGRIVNDQADDVGFLLVAQIANVLERANPVDHAVKVLKVVAVEFVVIDSLGVHEP